MPALDPNRWRLLSPYLDEALEIAPEQRATWLASFRAKNPDLAGELQTLLREHQGPGFEGFLQGQAPGEPSPTSLAGQTVGAYTLESPIGQGGMGTVWLARRSDGRFEGQAAVKFLNVAFLGGTGEARFRREGSFLARLAHPHIAHLIDAGVSAAGQPYLILERVEGQQIDEYCRKHALGIEARINLFMDVLAAVAHAHANLIVHRDIKPSNVLVTEDGQVKLLDFGIAKLLDEEAPTAAATALTREGGSALTLAYAAPEQLTGGAITTATDIYALGVLLYLLLTGKHPAESALGSHAELSRAIVEIEPHRPSDLVASNSKLRRALRGDLDTIVGKALKKNPAQRYSSATAFADDLRRYLRREPISARPDTIVYRAGKFVRRNRIAVGLAAGTLLAIAAGIAATALQARTARLERDFALRQLARADAINSFNGFLLFEAAPSGKPITMMDLLARAEEAISREGSTDEANRAEILLSVGAIYSSAADHVKARRVLEQARSSARMLPDPSTRARAACELGAIIVHQSAVSEAEKLIEEGLNQLPDDPRFSLDRGFCLWRGSEVAMSLGQSQVAVDRALRAQSAVNQSPYRSKHLDLTSSMILANAYRHAGKVREARAAFEKASADLGSIGYADTSRARVLFNNWGLALSLWGQPLDAERVLRRSVELGSDERFPAAGPFLNYARALNELGRWDEAADYAERAAGRAQAADDRTTVAQSLLIRASIYRNQGDFARAGQMLSEAESMLQRLIRPGHVGYGSLASLRALVAQGRGDPKTALDLADQSVTIAESAMKAGRDSADYLPTFLMRRSGIHLQLGHHGEAADDARRALKLWQEHAQLGTFSMNLGRAYAALGRALWGQGKRDEGRAAWRAAVEHLQSALGSDHSETREARELADARI